MTKGVYKIEDQDIFRLVYVTSAKKNDWEADTRYTVEGISLGYFAPDTCEIVWEKLVRGRHGDLDTLEDDQGLKTFSKRNTLVCILGGWRKYLP